MTLHPRAAIVLLLTLVLALGGCTRMVASFSDQPADRNHGKRTFGARIEDGSIERKVRINLMRTDERYRSADIDVTSYNGTVLLVGHVDSDDLKATAGGIAEGIRHVRQVHNEILVGPPPATLSGVSDGWITSKIKSRLLVSSEAPGRRTKVVTANGVVYLMGLLTQAEAEATVAQVQKVYGVQKIVKIIEYID